MRNIQDVCMSSKPIQTMVELQDQTHLVGEFMKARYCQRSNPNRKKGDTGDSISWKHVLQIRDKMDKHIQWKLNSRSFSFWQDNWLGIGHLAQFSTNTDIFNNSIVAEYQCNGRWNWSKIIQQATNSQVEGILTVNLPTQIHLPDQEIWTLNNDGRFTCSSAWNEIRQKKQKNSYQFFYFT